MEKPEIKTGSKVIIKPLEYFYMGRVMKPTSMIVEGLYWKSAKGMADTGLPEPPEENPLDESMLIKCAKCIWYNTRNELQSEFINLELLTGL